MRAEVGDEVVVETQTLGRPPRRGRVQEILGSADTEHFRVRWEDGHESVYFPGANGHIVRPGAGIPEQPSAEVVRRDSPSAISLLTSVERIEGRATLRTAAEMLSRKRTGALLVQESDAPLAVLTADDVVTALAEGANPDAVSAADAAKGNVVWAAADDTVDHVAESMRDARVGHVLIRDRSGLLGVAALADVLALALDSASAGRQAPAGR
jgi:CBS domain-containing protein